MMCIIFINILSTVPLDIFVGTVKQIVKFISYLATVTNSTYSFKEMDCDHCFHPLHILLKRWTVTTAFTPSPLSPLHFELSRVAVLQPHAEGEVAAEMDCDHCFHPMLFNCCLVLLFCSLTPRVK